MQASPIEMCKLEKFTQSFLLKMLLIFTSSHFATLNLIDNFKQIIVSIRLCGEK